VAKVALSELARGGCAQVQDLSEAELLGWCVVEERKAIWEEPSAVEYFCG